MVDRSVPSLSEDKNQRSTYLRDIPDTELGEEEHKT